MQEGFDWTFVSLSTRDRSLKDIPKFIDPKSCYAVRIPLEAPPHRRSLPTTHLLVVESRLLWVIEAIAASYSALWASRDILSNIEACDYRDGLLQSLESAFPINIF
jgi:hypothetical protein